MCPGRSAGWQRRQRSLCNMMTTVALPLLLVGRRRRTTARDGARTAGADVVAAVVAGGRFRRPFRTGEMARATPVAHRPYVRYLEERKAAGIRHGCI